MKNKNSKERLPQDLKKLVNNIVTILGEVIEEEGGKKTFERVDEIRKMMVKYRGSSQIERTKILNQLFKKIDGCSKEEKHDVAHSYTLMLEVINACEASYRTYRLRAQEETKPRSSREDNTMVFVLTAHPTEARTSENIELFNRIQKILVEILEQTAEQQYLESIIKHNLKLAWLIPVTRHKKPEVIDEANHLFSIIFRKDIFDSLLRADRDLGNVRIRTWVGGDKDGHPGVEEKVMMKCLQSSRNHFIEVLLDLLSKFEDDISIIPNLNLKKECHQILSRLSSIKKLKTEDAKQLKLITQNHQSLNSKYQKVVGATHPRLNKIEAVFKMFPGLVIPIELREDSGVIQEALNSKKPFAIERMLRQLSSIASKKEVKWYAQGLIISMCESYQDITNTVTLSKKTLGGLPIPVIPLFETASALENSQTIVEELLQNKEYISASRKNWKGNLEIMLGYSDSSKGMGVLPSRIGIAKTIRGLDSIISAAELRPIFFHGSGGSVDRGGGSLKEQTAWWPKSALQVYKATIQGEMVERTFTSPEVTLSSMDKIITSFKRSRAKEGPIKIDRYVEQFAKKVAGKYVEEISKEEFFEMVEAATPYSYLKVLKLGSRPTKRSSSKSKTLDFQSIRAIPWILCWTQTRTLFPTWWGIGSVWNEIKGDQKFKMGLMKSYQRSYLFASFIRTLGFTLSKVDLAVFELYLAHSGLSIERQAQVLKSFHSEFQNTVKFLRSVTEESELLWHKPWLADSIKLRSSMIHPLNILQIQANRDGDEELVRKTVAGISSGMMTTG